MATVIEDIVVVFEDTVGEPVVAHKLPDVLDGIELGCPGRERHKGDIGLRGPRKCAIRPDRA